MVFGRELVPLEGRLLAGREALELRFRIDVQPELEDRHAVLDELLLEVVDLPVGAAPLVLLREALDALHQHPPVPAPVEDEHAPRRGQPPPEAPQIVVRQLLGRRRGHRHHPVVLHVHGAGHAPDHASLAGGVPAFEDHRAPHAVFAAATAELP